MKRFWIIMALLTIGFVIEPGSDSNAAVIDKATYQVSIQDIQLNIATPDFIGQEIFVLFIPEFGQTNLIFVNVKENTFAGYVVAIRPPPDWLSKYIREDNIFLFMLNYLA